MYVLSYQGPNFTNVRAVVVESEDQAARFIANLPDGACGLVVDSDGDSAALKRLSGDLIIKFHNELAYPAVDRFPSTKAGREALVRALKAAAVPPEPKELAAPAPDDQPQDEADDTPTPAQESSSAETISADSEATELAAIYDKEADMAKAKTKSKTKKAPKAAKTPKAAKAKDGLPRAGSKKEALLHILQRKTGATMAEMLKTTGWKACLGTAKAVTLAAGLKFRHEKGEGTKASRWYAE